LSSGKVSPGSEARLTWRRPLGPSAALGLVVLLALGFAAMRAVGMFGPPVFRLALPLGFVLMMALPWVLLSREGRAQIGLAPAGRARHYLLGISFGLACATAALAIGILLFGKSGDNWFVTISNYYRSSVDTSGFGIGRLHLFFTVPALLFSPIGEELFFRGLLQTALEQRLSRRTSTILECGLFALIHLCHHGLVRSAEGFAFLPISGGLWVILMFGVALGFAWLRKYSGSVLPAVAAHAAFNLAMNLWIFEALWP